MAGVPGKNKIERGFRILWDNSSAAAKDLSGDLIPGSVSGGGASAEQIDMTGVSDSMKEYLAGYLESSISAKFHLNDTATTGAFTVIYNPTTLRLTGTLTLQWGSNGAAPSTGDPEWEGEYTLISAPVSFEGGRAVITCTWVPGSATAPAWGTVS